MAAARWLRETRWQDAGEVHATVVQTSFISIEYGSREWAAWSAFYRAAKGKTPPMDSRGGWRFLTRRPPGMSDAA